MEPHELAIAALHEVAHSSSHRRDISADKVASSRSSPNATGIDMTNNAIAEDAVATQDLTQTSQGSQGTGTSANIDGNQDNQNNTTSGVQPPSSNNSQSTTDGHDVSTPPTSTSDGFSSQSTNTEAQISQLSQLSQLAAAAQPMTSTSPARPNLSIAPTAGHKRTADGQVKPTPFDSPTSPYAPNIRGHSRNTSAVSISSAASSKIGELSSELRTRLSYAMVKVNNGWQSNSIDEVESMASQAGSPTSSTSTLHGRRNLITSPRTAIANMQGQGSSFSVNSATHAPTQDFDLYTSTGQPSRTYESFWRDHSTSNPLPAQKASLAPPADIRPTVSSRRSHTPKFSKPPAIPGQVSNSSLHTASTPRTPNTSMRAEYLEAKSLQTPTQKTIQEQDAMEALLFMSSPGNSGNMGSAAFPPRTQGSPLQQSPLRAEFGVHTHGLGNGNRRAMGRRVGFEKAATTMSPMSGSTGSSEAGGYHGKGKGVEIGLGGRRTDAIDRLLDEMGDSSSDEEDLVMKYSSPRTRVAAGRV